MKHTQAPICTDDFGSEVYVCCNTGAIALAQDCMFFGPFIAGCPARLVGINSAASIQARRDSRAWFDAAEANCNTCRHLRRVKHAKSVAGFLLGACANPEHAATPYAALEGLIRFHPDDPMLMPCYQPRKES